MLVFILVMLVFLCGVYYDEYKDEPPLRATWKEILVAVIITIVIMTVACLIFGINPFTQ